MLLAIDFDGTLCVQDTVDWFSARYAPETFATLDRLLENGTITLDECLARQVAPITAPEAEVVAFLVETVEVRPGAAELIAFCAAQGIEPVIVSSGFENLIRPILDANGLDVTVCAHRVRFAPDGMRVEFRGRAVCGVCGEPCKRGEVSDLAAGRRTAYVGDGLSDQCAAAAADVRFARDGLARHLQRAGLAYAPYEDLHDVRRGLAERLGLNA